MLSDIQYHIHLARGKKQIQGIGLSGGDLCCEPGSFVDSNDVKKKESQPEQLSCINFVMNRNV